MLKTHTNNETWLVQQPHHAQISGFLAAHWGGANGFTMPGHYDGATHPALWRDEVVLGIAEHDNGWWETEAMPVISTRDGLPVGIGEAKTQALASEFNEWRSDGFDRWRRGIDRLSDSHPYAALLTSLHAYWLYSVAFDDLVTEETDAFRHSIFGSPETASGLVSDRVTTRRFLQEQVQLGSVLRNRLAQDDTMTGALQPQYLNPHVRLLQIMDSLSLILVLNNRRGGQLLDVPRQDWNDRVTISWHTARDRRLVLDPYPFDEDPLTVYVPMRSVQDRRVDDGEDDPGPLTRIHAAPLRSMQFVLQSSRSCKLGVGNDSAVAQTGT